MKKLPKTSPVRYWVFELAKMCIICLIVGKVLLLFFIKEPCLHLGLLLMQLFFKFIKRCILFLQPLLIHSHSLVIQHIFLLWFSSKCAFLNSFENSSLANYTIPFCFYFILLSFFLFFSATKLVKKSSVAGNSSQTPAGSWQPATYDYFVVIDSCRNLLACKCSQIICLPNL